MPLYKPSPRRSTDTQPLPESQTSHTTQSSNRAVSLQSISSTSPSPKKQRSWTSFGSRAPASQNPPPARPSYENAASNPREFQSPTSPSRSPEHRPSWDSPQRAPPPPPIINTPLPVRKDSLITEDPFFRPPLTKNSNPNERPALNFSWKLGAQPEYPRRCEGDAFNDLEGGVLSLRGRG